MKEKGEEEDGRNKDNNDHDNDNDAKEKICYSKDRKEKKKERLSSVAPLPTFLPPNPFLYKGTSHSPFAKAAHVSLAMGTEGTIAKHYGLRQPESPFGTHGPSVATDT